MFKVFLPGQDYIIEEVLEQNVDIPVPQGRWRDGGGLQRFLPVQNSNSVLWSRPSIR